MQAPIIRYQFGDVLRVNTTIVVLNIIVDKQGDYIQQIFLVDFNNLHFCKQEIGWRQGALVYIHTRSKVDVMAHLHAVNENIDLPAILIIVEKQALMPMERIKCFVP